MATEPELKGAVHWIDHFVVGTNDMLAWVDWAVNATGVTRQPIGGLTTRARIHKAPIMCFLDWEDPSCRIGAFLQPEVYPASSGMGQDMPRYGFYVWPADLDRHVSRLDEHSIPHSDPTRREAEGEGGTVVYFEDPDGNQYEFWAPDEMPEGAMEVATPSGVGRISSVTFGSRDLQRTADFYAEYLGITPIRDPAISEETLVLRLRGGARVIYNLVDTLDERVAGHGQWWDMHTAFTIREEEFFPSYQRMWDGLPEEVAPKEDLNQPRDEEDELPARTGLHRSPIGYVWKETYKRGDEFYDWDGHAFHFVGGIPQNSDGSLTRYTGKEHGAYLEELKAQVAGSSQR